jgi:hypothetical protein
MIRYPEVGQSAQIWYGKKTRRKARASSIPWHAKVGTVVGIPRGRGPRNVAVRLDGLGIVIVPRGNLREPATIIPAERQGELWA